MTGAKMGKSGGVILIGQGDPEEIMKSPEFAEFQKQARAYVEQVDKEMKEGLSPEECAWYDRWRAGESLDWDKVPKAASSSILAAISAGTG
jgi:hypothetical protein